MAQIELSNWDDVLEVIENYQSNSVEETESTVFQRTVVFCWPVGFGMRFLSICRSSDVGVATRFDEEHNIHDTTRLYKDTIRKDTLRLGDHLLNIRALIQKELKIT